VSTIFKPGFSMTDAKNRLQRFVSDAQKVAMHVPRSLAEDILDASQLLVPVETGALRASGRVEETEDGAEVIYGNDMVNYALYVHEDLQARHPRGGQAKYLEQPALEIMRDAYRTVEDAVDDTVRKYAI